MEEIILTIEEILEGRRLVTKQEIKENMGKKESRQNTSRLVKVTKRGTVSEDETMQWYHFEMGGIPCVYVFPEKKFLKTVNKMNAPVLTLEEALEGRRQVTLNEVRTYTGVKNAKLSITQMVEITNQGISENGVRWYCFEMGGIPCVYKARKNYKTPYKKVEKAVMMLEEALEGRQRVTLDEVRVYTGKGTVNKRKKEGIRGLVEITKQGITKDGLVQWYHFELDSIPCVYIIKKLTVNNTNKMTEQERKFSENNMPLFYKFFNLKGFEKEVFYDVALSGYLKSVMKYCRDEAARKYKFSTVAYKAMIQKCNEYKGKILQEEAKCISLEKMREEIKEDWLLYRYINSRESKEDKFKEVMTDIFPYINVQQKKMMKLLYEGYNFREIQDICGWKNREEKTIREGIIQIAKRYYGYACSNKPCEVAQFAEIKTNDAEERNYEKHVLQQV